MFTDISHEIWDNKYRYKNEEGEPIDETLTDTWRRVSREPLRVSGAVVGPDGTRAHMSFELRRNDRGDALAVFMLTTAREIGAFPRVPSCTLRLPAKGMTAAPVVTRTDEGYAAHEIDDPGVLPRLSGRHVKELSVVCEHDWLVIRCDAVWPRVSRAVEGGERYVDIELMSRASWEPPYPPMRSHALQIPVHVPW